MTKLTSSQGGTQVHSLRPSFLNFINVSVSKIKIHCRNMSFKNTFIEA